MKFLMFEFLIVKSVGVVVVNPNFICDRKPIRSIHIETYFDRNQLMTSTLNYDINVRNSWSLPLKLHSTHLSMSHTFSCQTIRPHLADQGLVLQINKKYQ